MQFNNVCKPILSDVLASSSNILLLLTDITESFKSDCLELSVVLYTDDNIIINNGLDYRSNNYCNSYKIPKTGLVWFKSKPTNLWYGSINDVTNKTNIIKINDMKFVTYENISFLSDFFEILKQQLKLANITGNKGDKDNIIGFFKNLETNIKLTDEIVDDSHSLTMRLNVLKKSIIKNKKSIFSEIARINNEDNVSKLNSLQQADYLRTVGTTKNARHMAKRALNNGTDFLEILLKEIKDMKDNINELADIDDSLHMTSFFCQDTTLGGIKSVCELYSDDNIDTLDDMEIEDILVLFNIVGIACYGPIGDYPDPMTWRLSKIYPSTISISDIMFADMKKIKVECVAMKEVITNVVPVFEDKRIHDFLLKYAPTALEYLSGYGMRRIYANIPGTHNYTLANGIWKLVEVISLNKTSQYIEYFGKIIDSYETSSGHYFDRVLPFLTDKSKQNENMSMYICNNGITNMIGPLIKYCRLENDPNVIKGILRSLYNFEIFQITKKMFLVDNKNEKIKEFIYKLANIDLTKGRTAVTGTYEQEQKHPVFNNTYMINEEMVNEFSKHFWFLNYLPMLPELIYNTQNGYDGEYMVSDQIIHDKLGLADDYSLTEFKFYNIIQTFIYNEKAIRVDTDNNKSLLIDLGNKKNAEQFMKEYVSEQYLAEYNRDVTEKRNLRADILSEQLAYELNITDSLDEFIKLLTNGITINGFEHVLKDQSGISYMKIYKNTMIPIKTQLDHDKLKIFLTGTYNNTTVWNGGNVLRIDLNKIIKPLYSSSNLEELYGQLLEYYKNNNLHTYRDNNRNRHDHGNDKPSYWALGYKSIDEMISQVSDSEYEEYTNVHFNCCGFSNNGKGKGKGKGIINNNATI